MKANSLPDLDYLKQCFQIDSTLPSGLRWSLDRPSCHFKYESLRKTWKTRYAGKPCGCIVEGRDIDNRYYVTGLNHKAIFNHRIIYAIHNGIIDFNGKTIDHINGDSLNNDPQNLRLVTASENKLNSKIHKNNTTGHKNIFFREKYKSYDCGIKINGKLKHIGSYNTLEEALKARNSYIEHLKETIGDYFRT